MSEQRRTKYNRIGTGEIGGRTGINGRNIFRIAAICNKLIDTAAKPDMPEYLITSWRLKV